MTAGYGLAARPVPAAKCELLRRWRALTTLIGVAVLLTGGLSLSSGGTHAETAVPPTDARSGSLILKTQGDTGDHDTAAARLGIDVDVTVSGPTLRARVTQVFRNTTNDWVEGIYVYPLPDGSAVDTLKMVIGDRIVVGDIKERQQARAIYEQAKQNGQKAALTEQQRPNIFTNAVANIGPGETVLVQIEYQEPVHQSGDQFSLRIPLVIGPRYNPAPVVQTVDLRAGDNGWAVAAADPVPDRDRISPPVLDPRDHPPVNPTTISIRLQAGFPLGEVKSHFHNVKIDSPNSSTRVITLADGVVPADRDFELTWTAAPEKTPSVGVFREQVAGGDYLLAYVTPPVVNDAEQKRLPREVIFVIDNSGSMGGTSIAQAKAGLLYGLRRLQPNDRFNVIRFDHTMDVLFADVVPADSEHLAQAEAFVTALQAQGGTEMIPPMRAALTDRQADGNTVRQVVFLTDGCIGNEQQLFDTITSMRGRSRVFMVGIGSAPNTYLMTRAAELGRGTFTHIGSVEQVESRMRELFGKLESPAVTQLSVTFSDTTADMTPVVLPDLYRGEPLVLAAKLGKLAGTVAIKGRIGDRPWSVTLPLANAAEGRGLSKLWARRKIADAEVAQTLRTLSTDDANKTILALALEHQLVTRLTSLIAVDRTVTRPTGEPLKVSELPLNLPAGWDFEKVFGERPKLIPPAAPVERRANAHDGRVVGLAMKAASPAGSAVGQPQQGVVLPATATDAEWKMILGTTLMMLALMLLAHRRRKVFG
jgi:Ca-activated chloride channel family protein